MYKKKKTPLLKRLGIVLLCIPVLLAIALGIGVLLDRSVYKAESLIYPRKYAGLVCTMSEKYGVPESVIYAVIRIESNFDETAVSPAGALGLMQLTYDTYDWLYFIRHEEADHEKIMIPSYNVDAGTALLAWLYDKYGRWDTAYAAYNAGIGRVNNWLEDPEITVDGVLVNIPIEETSNYVRLVTKAEEQYRTLYAGDINTHSTERLP